MRDQEIVGLYEAYNSIYSNVNEEVEQLDEAQEARNNPEKYERSPEAREGRRRRSGMNDPHSGINSPAFHAFMAKQTGGGKKKKEDTKEEVETDLFDYILEHLVAEGYADTNENALVIMTNMSEDWRQSIVEKSMPPRRSKEERAKRAKELGDRQTIRNVVGKYNKEKSSSKQETPDKYYSNN